MTQSCRAIEQGIGGRKKNGGCPRFFKWRHNVSDAGLFAQERFWVAEENHKGDLNEAYLDDLNDAIARSEQSNGHTKKVSPISTRVWSIS